MKDKNYIEFLIQHLSVKTIDYVFRVFKQYELNNPNYMAELNKFIKKNFRAVMENEKFENLLTANVKWGVTLMKDISRLK